MRIALTGMRAAELQVTARARNVVNLNTPGYRPVEPVVTASEDGVRAIVRERPLSPDLVRLQADDALPEVSFAEEMVQMRLAEHAYRASAKVAEISARMGREAMEILA